MALPPNLVLLGAARRHALAEMFRARPALIGLAGLVCMASPVVFLYIVEPLAARGGALMGLLGLFQTHPPIEERIRRLLA